MDPLNEPSVAARRLRMLRVRERMGELDVDALLLSFGADLPWLTGYTAMPLERLTMLVLRRSGDPVLVVPALEAPRVRDAGDLFTLESWADSEDPIDLVCSLLGERGASPSRLGISDRSWATTVLGFQRRLTASEFVQASTVTAPLRAVKDEVEIDALRTAGAAADRVATALQRGEIGLIGRSEAAVSAELADRLLAEGHQHVNFAIVGSGPNAASPHHEPGPRVIRPAETVVCDFGGSYAVDDDVGYCSDITRTVVTGPPSDEITECYQVLAAAQGAAVTAARAGVAAEDVDRVAREVIDDAGLGEHFFHRTGHGIGIEEHEDPYLVAGNPQPLLPGHAFSVEPGIYMEGRFGMRLEDIVIVGEDGSPEPLNSAEHGLAVVEA